MVSLLHNLCIYDSRYASRRGVYIIYVSRTVVYINLVRWSVFYIIYAYMTAGMQVGEAFT